jgi:uncharacterized membrane protein YeaQ/YmgE (transglycosylase-associated protein family)
MSILAWIIVGLIAGFLANVIYPGRARGGVFGAMILGIVGGIVGGFLVGVLTGEDVMTGFNLTSILVATVGALLLVFGYNALSGSRGEVGSRF